MPTITVAILVNNSVEYLRRVLPSILSQKDVDFEVLFVDNGSNQETLDYLTLIEGGKVKVIRNEKNLGYTEGKNIAVRNSQGEYVLLLDDDIVLPVDSYLKDLAVGYKKLDHPAFLSPLLVDEGKNITRYYGISFTWYGMNIFREALPLLWVESLKTMPRIGAYHGGAVFFSRKVWEELGGYDERQPIMLDDFDLGTRAYLWKYSNYLFPAKAVLHIGKSRDMDKKRFAWKFRYYYSGFAATILKNYRFTNALLVLPFFTVLSLIMMATLTLTKKNIYIPSAFGKSYYLFLKSIPALIRARKIIQSHRLNSIDSFLSIPAIR